MEICKAITRTAVSDCQGVTLLARATIAYALRDAAKKANALADKIDPASTYSVADNYSAKGTSVPFEQSSQDNYSAKGTSVPFRQSPSDSSTHVESLLEEIHRRTTNDKRQGTVIDVEFKPESAEPLHA